jgi:hypothetical protein
MISKLSIRDVIKLQNKIKGIADEYNSLADAAQQYMSILYDELKESIILTRLFITIPFKDLPKSNKEFVTALAHSSGASKQIKEETLVLSLLGSRGAKPEWNDRRRSKGHVGIPLASSDFIDKIPMMSRLLKQLGAGIDWIDETDTKIVVNTFKSISGVFYVKDAETEVDNKGRKIIAAQDFVKEEKVKTVFGIGGSYLKPPLFFTNIIFLREFIEKQMAEQFMIQASKFKIATTGLVLNGKIFE